MRYITLLGSTGSIGCNVLNIVKHDLNFFKIIALVARKNINLMIKQCLFFKPKYVCMTNKKSAKILKDYLDSINSKIIVLSGIDNACNVSILSHVNIVVSAMSGIAGLLPTFSALKAGKRILLASKEILVICGKIFMQELKNNKIQLLPLDSEHSSIFQSLPIKFQKNLGKNNLKDFNISKIIITGSGGPFRKINQSDLNHITPKQAYNHPNWKMGKKISIDSATMINKGFEYIEARYLFNANAKQIELLIHPQSIVHSIICYNNGHMSAQLSYPSMQIYIYYAMYYPNFNNKEIKLLDLYELNKLSFENISFNKYPCLKLAIDAINTSQSAVIILNSANEVAVYAFINKLIKFTDIAIINKLVLNKLYFLEPKDIQDVIYIYKLTKKFTKKVILTKFNK
ncbi:MAG: 1-deoxy-D-xylulose-5-phosphate reductoisomerase [Candidatus Lightella neohaematopini]|nr:1-deoxy-D-xylulose-5-phosphate reductoisomerase [Candidatus Lightella neohaematopini]